MTDDELDRISPPPARLRLTGEAEVRLRELQRQHKRFAAWHFWGDVLEVTGLGMGAGVALYFGSQEHCWPLFPIALSCLWVAAFLAVELVRRRPTPRSRPEPPLAWAVEALEQVQHRLWLKRNVLWWHAVPIEVGLVFYLVWLAWWSRQTAADLKQVGLVTLLGAVFVGALHLVAHRSPKRKDFEPRLREWEAILLSLRSNLTGPLPPEAIPSAPVAGLDQSVSALWIRRALPFVTLVVVAAFLSWRQGVAGEVHRLLQAAAAAGYPTNGSQLNAWYSSVPDSDNAALLYTNGFALLEAGKSNTPALKSFDSVTLPLRTARPAAKLQIQLSQILVTQSNTLEWLHRARRLSQSRYPLDLSQGINAMFSHLGPLKECARLLAIEALEELDRGEPRRAVASVQASFALARSLAREPALISQMVRWRTGAITWRSLERALNRAALAPADLEALRTDLTAADQPDDLARGLAGERVMGIPYFRLDLLFLLENPENRPDLLARTAAAFGRASGFFERDLAFFLDFMHAAVAAAQLSAPESGRVARRISARLTETEKRFYIVSRLLLPSLKKVFDGQQTHQAHLRTAQTALALERYRLAHPGQLPAALAALVPQFLPAVPSDPFDGQPLRYQLLRQGYAVYSIGSDAKDDGGIERKPKEEGGKPTDPDDLVFRVER